MAKRLIMKTDSMGNRIFATPEYFDGRIDVFIEEVKSLGSAFDNSEIGKTDAYKRAYAIAEKLLQIPYEQTRAAHRRKGGQNNG